MPRHRPGASLSGLAATAALVLVAFVRSAHADVIHIDPAAPPATTLPPAEAQRLTTLLSASFPGLLSEVSPDDRRILTISPAGTVLLDVRSGATTPLNVNPPNLFVFTEWRWRDAGTLVAVGLDFATFTFVEVVISADTGAVVTRPLPGPVDAFPVSLSPRGSRVLVVREVAPAPGAARSTVSPLREVERPAFRRPGPAVFDADTRLRVKVAVVDIRLSVVDLATGREQVLLDMPQDMGVSGLSWSRDDARLALVRSNFPDFTRGGVVSPDSPTVQDGLGRLAPADNPFFTGNVLDVFDLGDAPGHRAIRPGPPGGPLFVDADWTTDGKTLVVRMGTPSRPRGREFPTYAQINGSSYRFYSPQGQRRGSLDRPEVDAPFALTVPLSPHEVVIHTVRGTSWRLYHYDLRTRQLRRLPTESGAIYQVRPTHHSRQLVYNFGSARQPYEIFRVGTDGRAPRALTRVNAAVAAANRVRVDRVPFLLGIGGTREGFLIQPAGAAFPPRNKPIVVWQQGGPAGPMTDDWGGFVEQPFNLLPNFGLAVLVVPLEGRFGFGSGRFDALADGKNFGQIDIDEQAFIVAQLVARGYTSPSRVGITGCSYGGYFASQSITRWPGLYAAANPQCSLLDLVNEWNTGFTGLIGYLEGRALDEDTREYERDSPVLQADRVKTPTLLFAGTRDFLPWPISLAFHDGIEGAGTPARFLVFEGEGHGLGNPSSQRVAGESQILWFRQHLAR
jgi:poly(3-hydroxybutyrate) depolymerase